MKILIALSSVFSLIFWATPGAAAPDGYALVVGSHLPGPGQQALRWSGQDARRVAEVLSELGDFEPSKVRVLVDPSRDALLTALDETAQRLARHQERVGPAVFLFYYSGHARADALNLGSEDLGLPELKARLQALGATVTLVVLDACQAGAISRVKGVEPAADFSHNSVLGLTTAGLAVMASSTGTELSQESEQLQGSFFTHHLVTGLRGAADTDADGQVTLSEAYRYAYHRTLVATAATAVGRQHVTLETELRGRGEMVLTRPQIASARLVFPDELAAEVVVHRSDPLVVVAEVHKAAGSALSLALPPGQYDALVRRDERVQRCELALSAGQATELEARDCPELELDEAGVKGAADPDGLPVETLAIELGLGGFVGLTDPYVKTLENFGFDPDDALFSDWPDVHFDLAVVWSFYRYAALVLTFGNLDAGRHDREIQEMSGDFRSQCFEWETWRLGLALRAQLPMFGGWLVPYLQAGGGLGIGLTDFIDGGQGDAQTHYGYYLGAAAGLQLVPTIGWWRYIGFYAQAEYLYAPVIDNLAGDTHDSGGLGFVFGMRGSF